MASSRNLRKLKSREILPDIQYIVHKKVKLCLQKIIMKLLFNKIVRQYFHLATYYILELIIDEHKYFAKSNSPLLLHLFIYINSHGKKIMKK